MILRFLLVVSYIAYCARLRTNPSRYFQLNATHFNPHKGYFSKLDIDQLIPSKWRLRQCLDNGVDTDFSYPVFVKPEWGQNGHGIQRADDAAMLTSIRTHAIDRKMPHIIQEAAPGAREFEIFWVLSAQDERRPAVFGVAEATNPCAERYPINSVKHPNTAYHDITASLDDAQLDALWQHMRSLGRLVIARAGVRADTIEQLINGDFHVIEVNLFVPMPLHVLDADTPWEQRVREVCRTTRALAHMTRRIPRNQATRSIFFRKWRLSRRNKMLPLTR
ncbi:MAG: hypothetical protein AAGA11_14330 [Pseudomonadota bacterium]